MEEKNKEEVPDFKNAKKKKGKYLVNFPNLKIPVEMSEKFYHILLKKQKAKV